MRMLFKLITNLIILFQIPLALAWNDGDKRLFPDDENVEVVYLFSYHCPGCFALDDYISLYESGSKKQIKRLPLFENNKWREGALSHLKLISLRDSGLITNVRSMHKFGFYLHLSGEARNFIEEVMQHPVWAVTRADINVAEIFAAQNIATIEQIMQEIKKERELSTPTVRISNKNNVQYIQLDENQENPGLHFIQTLHSTIKEMDH